MTDQEAESEITMDQVLEKAFQDRAAQEVGKFLGLLRGGELTSLTILAQTKSGGILNSISVLPGESSPASVLFSMEQVKTSLVLDAIQRGRGSRDVGG